MPLLIPGPAASTAYFTQTEPDGRVALWFGLSLSDPDRKFVCWADTPANADALAERLSLGEELDGLYALTGWQLKDITEVYGISAAEAHAFLEEIGGWLVEGQQRAGWAIIQKLRNQMPDARTKQQKADWDRAQEEADEQGQRALARW